MPDPKDRKAERVKEFAATLAKMDEAAREQLLLNVAREDPTLALEIQKQMFVFADLVQLEDSELQTLLREIPQPKLALALKTASEELKERFFRNLSSRAGEALRDEIESLGKRRLSEATAAQDEIIELAKRLACEGKLALH